MKKKAQLLTEKRLMETAICQIIFLKRENSSFKRNVGKSVQSTTMRYNKHYDTDENRKHENVFLEKQEINNSRW